MKFRDPQKISFRSAAANCKAQNEVSVDVIKSDFRRKIDKRFSLIIKRRIKCSCLLSLALSATAVDVVSDILIRYRRLVFGYIIVDKLF